MHLQRHGQGNAMRCWCPGSCSSSSSSTALPRLNGRCGDLDAWQRKPQITRTAAVVEPAQLAAIAAEPVAEVAVLAGIGALCARQGLLPLQGRRFLSGLVMNVFTPALLFSKLGTAVDVSEAVRLWPLAANMVACHVAGLGLGWLQIKALNIPASLAPQVTVMTALGNIGNLPLVLIPALLSRPGVLELINSSDAAAGLGASTATALDTAAASELGITYVMLGFFYASFIQFPLGYLLLQRKPGQQQQQQASALPAAVTATASGTRQEGLARAQLPFTAAVLGASLVPALEPTRLARGSDGNRSLDAPSATDAAGQAEAAVDPTQQQRPSKPQTALGPGQQQEQHQQLQTVLRGVFSPPVVACLLAIPVASLPELQSALFDPGGDLMFLGDVVSLLGAPLIPCLFLVLGANLAEGPGVAQVPMKVLVGLVSSKLVLHPLLGLAALLGALHAGVLPADTDPLMVLVMLLVWCPPTAVLTHSLATMLQNGEDQVSYVLFFQYLASLGTLPLCLALYLQLLQNGLLQAVVS